VGDMMTVAVVADMTTGEEADTIGMMIGGVDMVAGKNENVGIV